MLDKIGWFTWFEALCLAWLLSHFVPPLPARFSAFTVPVKIPVEGLVVGLFYFLVASGIAIAARAFRMHDRISDLFYIRSTFDVYRILTPLAGAVGIPVSPASRRILITERKRIMERTFYQYASFAEPKISKELVLGAVDIWTWYWIACELLVLLALAILILLFFSAYAPAAYMLGLFCALLLTFLSVFRVCGVRADRQIDEIISDPVRVDALKQEFTIVLRL